MTVDEARALLASYIEGSLEPIKALELEALLIQQPELQVELKKIKEENELFSQALSPLLSSRSARMRVSESMANIYEETARKADKSLSQKKQRINLWLALIILVGLFIIAIIAIAWHRLSHNRPQQHRVSPSAASATITDHQNQHDHLPAIEKNQKNHADISGTIKSN